MDYCDLELIALNSLASNANSCSSLVSTNTEQSGFYSDALARSLLCISSLQFNRHDCRCLVTEDSDTSAVPQRTNHLHCFSFGSHAVADGFSFLILYTLNLRNSWRTSPFYNSSNWIEDGYSHVHSAIHMQASHCQQSFLLNYSQQLKLSSLS
jgi:hypothetical protein